MRRGADSVSIYYVADNGIETLFDTYKAFFPDEVTLEIVLGVSWSLRYLTVPGKEVLDGVNTWPEVVLDNVI